MMALYMCFTNEVLYFGLIQLLACESAHQWEWRASQACSGSSACAASPWQALPSGRLRDRSYCADNISCNVRVAPKEVEISSCQKAIRKAFCQCQLCNLVTWDWAIYSHGHELYTFIDALLQAYDGETNQFSFAGSWQCVHEDCRICEWAWANL